MKEMKVKMTFTEEVLGTSSNNPELHDEYIASKAPDAPSRKEEVEALGVGEVIEKDMTVFPRTKNQEPFIWNYQLKGFFKDACGMLRKVTGTKSQKLKAYKKEIDGLIFVNDRKILIQNYGHIGECQRPLRASTAQGERIALAHSETIPAGSYIEFTVKCLKDDLMGYVKEWLDYGKLRGFGQWRNSGKGCFVWEGEEIKHESV